MRKLNSNCLMKERIQVLGHLNKQKYMKELREIGWEKIGVNEAILFCHFSDFDIPLGRNFRVLIGKDGQKLAVNAILEGVTQQLWVLSDEIPHGWKTICRFSFLGGVPGEIESLPTIGGWYESKTYVWLCVE